jgi:hypothetical protein
MIYQTVDRRRGRTCSLRFVGVVEYFMVWSRRGYSFIGERKPQSMTALIKAADAEYFPDCNKNREPREALLH